MPFPCLDSVRLRVKIGVGELIPLLAALTRVDIVRARKPDSTCSGIDARCAERTLLTIGNRILYAPIAIRLVFEKVRQGALGDVIEQARIAVVVQHKPIPSATTCKWLDTGLLERDL